MPTTRVVLAVTTIALLSAGSVATYVDREFEGAWLLAFGFATATLWGLLTIVLGLQGETDVSQSVTVAMSSVAMVLTLFFLQKGFSGERML